MSQGWWENQSEATRSGQRVTAIGLITFVVGFVFSELLIGISGFGRGWSNIVVPALLIGGGLYLLLARGWSGLAVR